MKVNPYKLRLVLAGFVGILSILAVCGVFYPVNFLDIQFTPLFQRLLFDFSITAIILFFIILLINLLFGRFYCSTICPLGILQEFCSFLRGKNVSHGNYGFKYLIAGVSFGALIGGSAIIIRYLDPYTVFGSAISMSIFGIIFLLTVFVLVGFKNRFFCTNICPVGAVLGLISKFSINKIYINEECVQCGICAKNCPSGCINYKEKNIDNEICVKCLKCISVCKKDAIKYGVQPKKISLKRRDLLWGIGALALLGAGYSAGITFTKNIAKKVKDIILPAGAINANHMANKCLNCNLCINNCPNGILSKSDDNFSVVHIDYTKGKHFCEYNCHKCSEVCPSGAIKKISLEEKQNTRIGMAGIKSDNCAGCGACERVCPVGAITMVDNKAVIDGSKCIGCGKCVVVCKPIAIDIFAVKEQYNV